MRDSIRETSRKLLKDFKSASPLMKAFFIIFFLGFVFVFIYDIAILGTFFYVGGVGFYENVLSQLGFDLISPFLYCFIFSFFLLASLIIGVQIKKYFNEKWKMNLG